MIKISTEYESFDDQKVENIVKELIKRNMIFYVGITNELYKKIQSIATNMDYMNVKSRELVLSNEDYLKVSDKIWEYITSGILAPSLDYNNPWFPKLHLTEKAKKLIEKQLIN